MRYKLLGRTGLRVSEICLGCMTFGNTQWGTPEAEAAKIYASFRDRGGNFLDTSNESYADGHSEEIIGRLVSGHRDEAVITTKFTYARMGDHNPNAVGNHRKSLKRSLEGSLKRLATDYVDLLWVHAWDEMTPIDEMMRALDDVVREGKVLYIGASNLPAWIIAQCNTLADCRGLSPFVAQQIEYNLIERTAEHDLLPMAHALNLGIAAYSPLRMGILSGKYAKESTNTDPKRLETVLLRKLDERSMAIAHAVGEIAQSLGRSSSQVALNWLRAKDGVIPLVGVRTLKQWEDNIGCLDFTLDSEQVARLDQLSTPAPTYRSAHFSVVTEMIQPGIQGLVDRHR